MHRIEEVVAAMADLAQGALVILTSVSSSLLKGLPKKDQEAIRAIVGKPVTLAGFSYGQAELEFKDEQGDEHTIWVARKLLIPA